MKLVSRKGEIEMKLVSRKEAIESGLQRYFTGTSCKQGHICERRVSSYECLECHPEIEPKKYSASWYKKYPNYVKEENEKYDRTRPKHWIGKESPDYWKTKVLAHKIRAEKLNRLPRWSNQERIAEIIKAMPENMTLDHIVPLQNDIVSGLHVPENLQYLTGRENSLKSNYFTPRRSVRNYAVISLI
jgi:hypothetical protein